MGDKYAGWSEEPADPHADWAVEPLPSREATAAEKERSGGLSARERVVEYLRSRPAAIADTGKALVTKGGGVDQAFADRYLMGLPAAAEAAIDTAPTVGRAIIGAQSSDAIGPEWSRNFAKRRAPYAAAEAKEPGAALIGSMLGPNIAGKATAGQRMLSSGAQSGIDAATHGGNAGDAVELGMGTQALFEAAPVGRFSAALRKASGVKAVRSMGTRTGIDDRLARMGIAPEDVPELGNRFLDEGFVPSGFNPFQAPIEGAAQRVAKSKAAGGKLIGDAIDAAESSGASFDPMAAAARMRSKMNAVNSLEVENAAKGEKLASYFEDLTPQGEYASGGGFAAANRLKSQAWKGADFRTDPKMSAELYKQSVRGARDEIGDQVEAATSPEVAASLRRGNSQWGLASKAETLLDNAASRDAQKQPFGAAKHTIAAVMGGMGGVAGGAGGVSAAIAPYVTEALVSRGPAIAAHAYRGMSKAPGIPGRIGKWSGVASGGPSVSGTAGSRLEDYLRPKDDEERQEEGAAWLKGL